MSLRDIWQFETDQWGLRPAQPELGGYTFTLLGKQLYTVVAILQHRQSSKEVDLIRLFSGNNGSEVIAQCAQPEELHKGWDFGLGQPVPAGRHMSIFYARMDKK